VDSDDFGWVLQRGDAVFVLMEGFVNCVEAETGETRWSRPADRFVGVVGKYAFVADDAGTVSAVAVRNGRLGYQFSAGQGTLANTRLVLGRETLYVVDDEQLAAYPLQRDAQRLWSVDLPFYGPQVTWSLLYTESHLYLHMDSDLYPLG
jgi:outer membrane protein assembly factor BamB